MLGESITNIKGEITGITAIRQVMNTSDLLSITDMTTRVAFFGYYIGALRKDTALMSRCEAFLSTQLIAETEAKLRGEVDISNVKASNTFDRFYLGNGSMPFETLRSICISQGVSGWELLPKVLAKDRDQFNVVMGRFNISSILLDFIDIPPEIQEVTTVSDIASDKPFRKGEVQLIQEKRFSKYIPLVDEDEAKDFGLTHDEYIKATQEKVTEGPAISINTKGELVLRGKGGLRKVSALRASRGTLDYEVKSELLSVESQNRTTGFMKKPTEFIKEEIRKETKNKIENSVIRKQEMNERKKGGSLIDIEGINKLAQELNQIQNEMREEEEPGWFTITNKRRKQKELNRITKEIKRDKHSGNSSNFSGSFVKTKYGTL